MILLARIRLVDAPHRTPTAPRSMGCQQRLFERGSSVRLVHLRRHKRKLKPLEQVVAVSLPRRRCRAQLAFQGRGWHMEQLIVRQRQNIAHTSCKLLSLARQVKPREIHFEGSLPLVRHLTSLSTRLCISVSSSCIRFLYGHPWIDPFPVETFVGRR